MNALFDFLTVLVPSTESKNLNRLLNSIPSQVKVRVATSHPIPTCERDGVTWINRPKASYCELVDILLHTTEAFLEDADPRQYYMFVESSDVFSKDFWDILCHMESLYNWYHVKRRHSQWNVKAVADNKGKLRTPNDILTKDIWTGDFHPFRGFILSTEAISRVVNDSANPVHFDGVSCPLSLLNLMAALEFDGVILNCYGLEFENVPAHVEFTNPLPFIRQELEWNENPPKRAPFPRAKLDSKDLKHALDWYDKQIMIGKSQLNK